MSSINANTLRFGFFDGSTQWVHVVNIKIIDSNDVDIAPSCTFTSTSTSGQWQSQGNLKDLVTDGVSTTFSHSELLPNQNIQVDFGRNVDVKQIVIENRNESILIRDRIINAQFVLNNESGATVYVSDKISVGGQYFYVNMDSTAVLSSLTPNPPITPTSPPTAPNVSTTDSSTTDVSPKYTDNASPPDYTIPISILGVSVIALGIIGYFLYSEMIKKK